MIEAFFILFFLGPTIPEGSVPTTPDGLVPSIPEGAGDGDDDDDKWWLNKIEKSNRYCLYIYQTSNAHARSPVLHNNVTGKLSE